MLMKCSSVSGPWRLCEVFTQQGELYGVGEEDDQGRTVSCVRHGRGMTESCSGWKEDLRRDAFFRGSDLVLGANLRLIFSVCSPGLFSMAVASRFLQRRFRQRKSGPLYSKHNIFSKNPQFVQLSCSSNRNSTHSADVLLPPPTTSPLRSFPPRPIVFFSRNFSSGGASSSSSAAGEQPANGQSQDEDRAKTDHAKTDAKTDHDKTDADAEARQRLFDEFIAKPPEKNPDQLRWIQHAKIRQSEMDNQRGENPAFRVDRHKDLWEQKLEDGEDALDVVRQRTQVVVQLLGGEYVVVRGGPRDIVVVREVVGRGL